MSLVVAYIHAGTNAQRGDEHQEAHAWIETPLPEGHAPVA
jgi:hypothetical protein